MYSNIRVLCPQTKERNSAKEITKEITYISVPLVPKVKTNHKNDVTTRILLYFPDQKDANARFYICVGTPKYLITKPIENQVNIVTTLVTRIKA